MYRERRQERSQERIITPFRVQNSTNPDNREEMVEDIAQQSVEFDLHRIKPRYDVDSIGLHCAPDPKKGAKTIPVEPAEGDHKRDGEQEPALVRIPPKVYEVHSSCRKLQEELSEAESTCLAKGTPNTFSLSAGDLTFVGIAEQIRGYSFQLQMWETASGIRDLKDIHINGSGAEVLDTAARILQRLVESARDLKNECVDARPQNLKLAQLPEVSDAELERSDGESEDEGGEDLTETPAFFIQSQLRSLQLNMQSLAILLRPVQDLSPSYNAEKAELQKLVEEVHKYFGSPEALGRYAIDPKFAGRKALEEARYVARRVDSRRGR